MERDLYFENIKRIPSPLLPLMIHLDKVIKSATSGTIPDILIFADNLRAFNTPASISRADFIKHQCEGKDATALFEQHHESWGIPKFEESLLTADDFKYGFLYTFRDHTTSWCEDMQAREWFYTHIEARFACKWELWSCDLGFEEIVLKESGEYKNILWALINDQDYSPFISPVFSKEELHTFYNSFDEDEADFDKEALLEIMQQNINW